MGAGKPPLFELGPSHEGARRNGGVGSMPDCMSLGCCCRVPGKLFMGGRVESCRPRCCIGGTAIGGDGAGAALRGGISTLAPGCVGRGGEEAGLEEKVLAFGAKEMMPLPPSSFFLLRPSQLRRML